LRDAHRDFAARGYDVVAVGQGSGSRSAAFRRDNDLPFVVLGDPERSAYAAFGLDRGSLLDMLRPSLVVAGVKATLGGARQGKTEGDPAQMPGTFLIDRGGIVRYAHPGGHAGDIPSARELLRAIDGDGSG